ncbi:MAG: hypothetical protein FJ044_00685, partial [Candidatus Cloacimonetes bacterium]|nr:hypothetical protein [Candidatus Cloacimonadota bacterium]
QPQPSETWILIVKFQITQTVEGVPVLAANPRARDDRETLKAEIARFEAELAAEAAKVDAFDEDGEPQTAMAAALKKAGIV